MNPEIIDDYEYRVTISGRGEITASRNGEKLQLSTKNSVVASNSIAALLYELLRHRQQVDNILTEAAERKLRDFKPNVFKHLKAS